MGFDKPYYDILLGGILEPGTSISNKTGGWRSLKPIILLDKCTKCKRCWLVCPDGIIYIKDEKMVIDYDYCKGCGVCAIECPKDAIEMEVEVK